MTGSDRRKLHRFTRLNNNQSGFALGLAEAGDAIAFLPLTTLAEKFYTFKAFEHIALGAQGARATETTMLRHKLVLFLCFNRFQSTKRTVLLAWGRANAIGNSGSAMALAYLCQRARG